MEASWFVLWMSGNMGVLVCCTSAPPSVGSFAGVGWVTGVGWATGEDVIGSGVVLMEHGCVAFLWELTSSGDSDAPLCFMEQEADLMKASDFSGDIGFQTNAPCLCNENGRGLSHGRSVTGIA